MSDRRQPLTRRQSEVLATIRDYRRLRGIAPTLEEIGHALGVHRVTIFEHVRELERKGWLRTGHQASRSIEIVEPGTDSTHLPILGRIAAGHPIEATDGSDVLDFHELFPPGRDLYVLRVRGESMIEDAIRDGDLVIVDGHARAEPGSTVVALVDGAEATLKRFYPSSGTIRLEPRNPTMEALVYPAERVAIQGVVVGVVRKV